MKNLIVLLFVGLTGVSCFGVVVAQELLIAPAGVELGDDSPELALPPMPDPAVDEGQQEQIATTPSSDSWESDEYAESYTDDFQMFPCNEPVLESTGTWIRRGFWYAEVDAVIFNRKFNRDGVAIIGQPVGTSSSVIQRGSLVENQLRLNGSKPGAEGVPRFTLGHFLFRDHKNRDHVGEFTIYGGGEWTQKARLDANPNNNVGSNALFVPVIIDMGNFSFDGAQSSQFRYDSRFNSFELNYLVKERMGRDHVEMEPSGRWVRRAGPSFSRSLLAGLRFFDLNEDFDWTATDIDVNNDGIIEGDGIVRSRTDNDMIGTQLGFSWMYETARWSGGIRTKGGMFLNLIDLKTHSTIPNETDTVVTDSALEADELSFIGEAAFIGKWHLRPNFSLRVGAEVLFLSSTAVAPAQSMGIFLSSGPTSVSTNGDVTYLGGSIGFEGYW